MGTLPNVLTGYQVVTNQEIGKEFDGAWGSYLPRKMMSRSCFNI
jgi:predicted molibdopterin-dependent oxidoreductase YjgC